MSDSINPDHYRNGPFECIELTRLLSFEWGNVVKYCFRDVWAVMAGGCRQHALTILIRKIAEIENGRTKEES